jgi:hypothetical protein
MGCIYRHAKKYAADDQSPQQICAEIFTTLRSGEEDIQIPLVEILGYEAFDFIEDLISNRATIVHNIMRMVRKITE